MAVDPLLDWIVYSFDPIRGRIDRFSNLVHGLADLPESGIVAVAQCYDDVDGTRNKYIVEGPDWYVFYPFANMFSGGDDRNIAWAESLGVVFPVKLRGLWLPNPWFSQIMKVMASEPGLPNALDSDSMSREQRSRFDAAVLSHVRAGDEFVEKLEQAIADLGGDVPDRRPSGEPEPEPESGRPISPFVGLDHE